MIYRDDFSLIGAIIIVMGLYSVVWGKSKEGKINDITSKDQELPVVDIKERSTIVDDNINEKKTSIYQEH